MKVQTISNNTYMQLRIIAAATLFAGAVALGCMMPTSAHAAGLTQDQLSNIAQMLAAQGVDQNHINKVVAVLTDAASSTAGVDQRQGGQGDQGKHIGQQMQANCQVPGKTLSRGARSDEVKALQQRLADDGVLTQDNVSGFFGSTTQQALMRWQSEHGVVASGTPETTGFGAVGPKTIEAMGRCNAAMRGNDGPGGNATMGSSTQGMPRPPKPPRPEGQPTTNSGVQSGAQSANQFLSDYNDEFNANMAAVVTAPFNLAGEMLTPEFLSAYSDEFNANMAAVAAAPFEIATDALSDMLYQMGVQ